MNDLEWLRAVAWGQVPAPAGLREAAVNLLGTHGGRSFEAARQLRRSAKNLRRAYAAVAAAYVPLLRPN